MAVCRQGRLRTELATATAALVVAAILGGLHVVNRFLEAGARGRWGTTTAAEPAGPSPTEGLRRGADLLGSRGRVCLPDAATKGRACGVAPPTRRTGGHTAHRMTTVAGESFWVMWPDDPAPARKMVAIPRVPLGWLGELGRSHLQVTTDPPHDAVTQLCPSERICEPAPVVRQSLPNGATHTGWRLGPRQAVDVVTVQMGHWTLALREEAESVTEFVAGILRWDLDRGFLVLESTDPTYPVYADWAGVRILALGNDDPYSLTITPGCELSQKRPDLGRADAATGLRLLRSPPGGEWCAGGRFWVHARDIDGRALQRLHRELMIRPA